YFDPRGADDLTFPLPAVPYLKLAAVHDAEAGQLTLFALKRHLSEEMEFQVRMDGFAGLAVDQALTLHDSDLAAVNTREDPDRVTPSPLAGTAIEGTSPRTTLPPASWASPHLGAGG